MMNSISDYNPHGILSSPPKNRNSKDGHHRNSLLPSHPFHSSHSLSHLLDNNLMLRTSNHPTGCNITLIATHPGRPSNNFLLLLHKTAARTAPREETVGGGVTLEVILCADFATADEVEDPAETTVLGAAPHYALSWWLVCCEKGDGEEGTYVSVEALIAGQSWVAETSLCLAVDEAGAAPCFEACSSHYR